MVTADVTFLSSKDGLVRAKDDVLPQPYQRLVWMPDIDLLQESMSSGDFGSIGKYISTNHLNKTERYETFLQVLGNVVGRTKATRDVSQINRTSPRPS